MAFNLRASRFRLELITGEGSPDRTNWSTRCLVGRAPSCDVALHDGAVAELHCEVLIDDGGVRVRNLGGAATAVDGVRVVDGYVRDNSIVRVGGAALLVSIGRDGEELRGHPVSLSTSFGSMVGASAKMRMTFAKLERAARSNSTVLLLGETGTGKELAADSIHRASDRREGPMVVIDCGAIPANLLESELFGHERGSFTGAAGRRIGAFEQANGGTIFLDEIGELPAELQPKLLRVLERREVRRVGSNTVVPLDVRVIAATHRDLPAEVRAGRFRADLYFRLAVIHVPIPSLRSRPMDIPLLADRILTSLGIPPDSESPFRAPSFLALLQATAWPGNVRELRNYLERCVVLGNIEQLEPAANDEQSLSANFPANTHYESARSQALADFERQFVDGALRRYNGRVADAARASGIDRRYLYRLMQRHGVKP